MSESKFKTMRHIETVRNYLGMVIREFLDRQEKHDQSKLESPEVESFEIYTPKLRGLTYGSEEYKACLRGMKPAIDHHNANNSHHPEHYVMWQCVVCKAVCKDDDKFYGPNDENKVFYCPSCCKHGMIYECSLEKASGINGMNLFDLLEMLCDWKAAGLRHNDGNIYKSLEINKDRFKIDPQLLGILKNTVDLMETKKVFHKASES